MILLSFWGNLPLLAKIGLVLVLLIAAVFVGLVATVMRYERTDEKPLVNLTCGANHLTVNLVVRRYVGGTSSGHQLHWNNRAVATHRLDASRGNGQTDQPIPTGPDDQKGLIIKRFAETVDQRAWTVWVNPEKFSRAEFDALATCLQQNRDEIARPLSQVNYMQTYDSPIGGYDESFQIGQVVYGLAKAIEPHIYTWEAAPGRVLEITIWPNEQASMRDDYMVIDMGHIYRENGQRVFLWRYPLNRAMLGRNLPAFKNKQGQSLTNRYQLQHDPADDELFFREAKGYQEFIRFPHGAALGNNIVSAMLIEVAYPTVSQNYDAGTIITDSTGTGKPVFSWKLWPGHPLTETDLRQFKNEQGQSLGERYDLRQ